MERGRVSSVGGGAEREEFAELLLREEASLPRVREHLVRQRLLEDLPVVDLLLDRARANEAVDGDGFGLPEAPRPLARLRFSFFEKAREYLW